MHIVAQPPLGVRWLQQPAAIQGMFYATVQDGLRCLIPTDVNRQLQAYPNLEKLLPII